MIAEERIAALEVENARLRAEVAALLARVKELEGQQATDSHNSSKPPSSDGPRRVPRSLRGTNGKKPGGQPEHRGRHLRLADRPDHIVVQRPTVCRGCAAALAGAAVEGVERRQVIEVPPVRPLVIEVPPVRPLVTEYQGVRLRCPQCHALATGSFPAGVTAPVQYGPRLRASAVYLTHQQLLPYGRARAVLRDLLGCPVSEGTLAALAPEAADRLAPVEEGIAAALRAGPLLHNDETSLRVRGRRWWLHTAATARLTHYAIHPQRGSAATDAIGILPVFTGTSVHDGWAPYRRYACRHALCNAHHLRELAWVAEQDQQAWAAALAALLRAGTAAVDAARERGKTALPAPTRAAFRTRYAHLLADGRAANPPPPPGVEPSRRGRRKQSKAKNLLDRLARTDEVLAFMEDFTIPFDNNQAEQDVRMVKVQQKVSGPFRSAAGADTFARVRGYLSTMRKQGIPTLAALESVFHGHPMLPCLGS